MDSAEQVAEGIVTLLNANGNALSIAFNAELALEEVEIARVGAGASVHVYPYDETEEALDRGDMVEATRTVSVVVQSPLHDAISRGACLIWLNEIKSLFREHEIETVDEEDDGSWRWQNNETVTLYDFDVMKEKRQFLSIFNAVFFHFG